MKNLLGIHIRQKAASRKTESLPRSFRRVPVKVRVYPGGITEVFYSTPVPKPSPVSNSTTPAAPSTREAKAPGRARGLSFFAFPSFLQAVSHRSVASH